MSPQATEGVASREALTPCAEDEGRARSDRPPSGRFAAISPSRGEISRRYTNPRFTIIASGDGILPRNAVYSSSGSFEPPAA
jgi:hypothetical protein